MTEGAQLVLTALPDIPLVQPGDNLAGMIADGLRRAHITLQHGDLIIVAQKVVSKAEGRLVNLTTVHPSAEAVALAAETGKDPRLLEVILGESRSILRSRRGLVIAEHRLGFICANAGVDHSNVRGAGGNPEDWVLMLPEDPDASAERLRQAIAALHAVQIGVLIIDSHGRAWRNGAVGVAIGVAGVPALVDLRGTPDLYGDLLEVSQLGLGDEAAAAASLLMGQADEGRPVIHLRGLPYPLRESKLEELLRPLDQDLFR